MRRDGPNRMLDFTLDGGPGPAKPLSRRGTDRLIQEALEQAFASLPRHRYRGSWLVAAAALVLVAVPAGATIWHVVRPVLAPILIPRTNTPDSPAVVPKPPADVPELPAVVPEPAVVAPEPDPPVVAPEPVAKPRHSAARSRRASRAARTRLQGAPAPAASMRRQETPAYRFVESPSAAELLDLASRQRGARDWAAAARTYERLVAAYPDTGAAYVAHVARATLALEHFGRPKDAVRGFAAALSARSRGPLHAEARWGMARAYRALGDHAAEREALGTLLRDYPASAYAASARSRLAALKTP